MEDNDFLLFAFTALFVGIFAKLKARDLLSNEDVRDIFETATLGLEERGLQDKTRLKAHNFLSRIQSIVDKRSPKPSGRDQ